MKSFYCILYDDDNKCFDVAGPVSDDTPCVNAIVEAQHRGLNLRCSAVEEKAVSSIDVLKRDGDPPGYRYQDGLFEKYDIRLW